MRALVIEQAERQLIVPCRQASRGVAKLDGTRLTIASAKTGATASIELLPYTDGDAHDILLGSAVPLETRGEEPTPATITGEVDLLAPVNLDRQRTLRLAIDGGQPIDIDVAGAAALEAPLPLLDLDPLAGRHGEAQRGDLVLGQEALAHGISEVEP